MTASSNVSNCSPGSRRDRPEPAGLAPRRTHYSSTSNPEACPADRSRWFATESFSRSEFLALAETAFARTQAYSTIAIALALSADIFTTSGTVEGLFGTAFATVQLLIVLPLGRGIDTGNAKRYLLAGLVLNIGVFGGFALVDTVAHVILMRVVQASAGVSAGSPA